MYHINADCKSAVFTLFANSSESCKSLMIDQNSYMYKT